MTIYKKLENISYVKENNFIIIDSSRKLYNYIKSEYDFNDKKEVVFIVLVNNKNNVTSKKLLSIGDTSFCFIDMKEIVKLLCLDRASGFFLVHNHPSGDVNPSTEDVEIWKRLKEIGKLLDIRALDSIILGSETYYSLFDEE